jgi:hypothetical protein
MAKIDEQIFLWKSGTIEKTNKKVREKELLEDNICFRDFKILFTA